MPGPLRIVHLASGDLFAGAEMQLYTLASHLNQSAGIHLVIILLNHGVLEERLLHLGVTVFVFDERHLSTTQILRSVVLLCRKLRPHIIHSHRTKENILGSIAALLIPQAISVRTAHGARETRIGIHNFWKNLYPLLDRFCGRFLQKRIVAVSNELKDHLNRYYRDEQLVVIENGVDCEAIQKSSSIPIGSTFPAELIKICFVGRFASVKRPDLFLSVAAATISRFGPIFRFYLFGDGPLLDKCKSQSEKLSIVDHVQFMGHIDNIYPYITKVDILLITSDHEGLPMTLLEAMFLGIPIVSHAVGGIPKAVEFGKYAYLVYEQETSSYLEAISNYLSNPNDLITKAASASPFIKTHYSSGLNASKYLDLYRSLVSYP